MKNPRSMALERKLFVDLNVKEPNTKTTDLLDKERLPKSGYLNKNTRGMRLVDLTLDQLEYLAFTCKQCPEKLKLKSLVMYFIVLYKALDENDMTEEDFDKSVEDFLQSHIDRVSNQPSVPVIPKLPKDETNELDGWDDL